MFLGRGYAETNKVTVGHMKTVNTVECCKNNGKNQNVGLETIMWVIGSSPMGSKATKH